MRKLSTLIPLVIIVILSSCGKKVLIDETRQFDNGVWMRFEPVEFQVDVTDNEPSYCISVTLSYDTSRYKEDMLPLVVDYFPDSNELHNFIPNIRLRDKRGALRGETIGNYCTVTDTIDPRRVYNRVGKYTYRIKQRTSKYEIYGIHSLRLQIERI